jgi:hypothetical protein
VGGRGHIRVALRALGPRRVAPRALAPRNAAPPTASTAAVLPRRRGSRAPLTRLRAPRPLCALCWLSTLLLTGGCIDFAAPHLPNSGAPALLQLSVSLQEVGVMIVNGQVQPGRDSLGVTRVPLDSALYVAGQVLEADTVLARNTLPFSVQLPISPSVLGGPITMAAPAITGIEAPAPFLVWYALVKEGSDTVTVERGGEAVLRVNSHLGVQPVRPGRRDSGERERSATGYHEDPTPVAAG